MEYTNNISGTYLNILGPLNSHRQRERVCIGSGHQKASTVSVTRGKAKGRVGVTFRDEQTNVSLGNTDILCQQALWGDEERQ